MFKKFRLGLKSAIAMAMSGHSTDEIRHYLRGEMELGGLATAIIIAVVVIVIAVVLIPTIFSAVVNASSNSTLTSNPHYSAAFSLLYIVPLVFVAGILVVILELMFRHRKD